MNNANDTIGTEMRRNVSEMGWLNSLDGHIELKEMHEKHQRDNIHIEYYIFVWNVQNPAVTSGHWNARFSVSLNIASKAARFLQNSICTMSKSHWFIVCVFFIKIGIVFGCFSEVSYLGKQTSINWMMH